MLDIFNVEIVQGILKLIFIIGALFYLIYTFVVFRQIQIMKKTLITSFSPSVNLLGFFNLLLALGLFVGFLLFL
jgi:hypothetical protein